MAPPVVPRPANVDAGPRKISICSVKKFSRMLTAGSRTPSMKTLLRAAKPRMKKRSPKALPPSPVPSRAPRAQGHARDTPADFLEGRDILVIKDVFGEHRDRARVLTTGSVNSAMRGVWPCRAPPGGHKGLGLVPGHRWRQRPVSVRSALAFPVPGRAGGARRGRGAAPVSVWPQEAVGALRSTVTGGSWGSCASAPFSDLAATKQATAIFRDESTSRCSS